MDVLSVIEGFLQIVPKTLKDGYTVDFGDLGNMGVVAKSNSVEKEENFNSSSIEGVKVAFRPGKLFKEELGKVEFVKISVPEGKVVVAESVYFLLDLIKFRLY
ncbi:hypothetical protein GNY23_20040 [Labilibaculum sp. 44]|uniref:HU domain-containing protein n=1 Tax=Labilibaculum euxinus TaxID=2686357 RepID=A0A7M4DBS2_9BACT|nr:hypothetical protein [Labilibaculum euxinus]MVB09306.1 hypothetical protein [Labilibaculum euxinus]